MYITMHDTRRGSEDGHKINTYESSVTYDVAEDMGRAFIYWGWARNATTQEVLTHMDRQQKTQPKGLSDEDTLSAAAEREEMRNIVGQVRFQNLQAANSNYLSTAQVMDQFINALFEPRVPTNPATYRKGEL